MRLRLITLLMVVLTAGASSGSAQSNQTEYRYARVSPWVALDGGLAGQYADCKCDAWYGGGGITVSGSVGVTVFQRASLGLEQAGMFVTETDYGSVGRLRLVTTRVNVAQGFVLKAGVGRGRYTAASKRLVEDRVAWVAGIENCGAGRVDVCQFGEYSESANGPAFGVDGQVVRYRLRTFRLGLAFRLHMREGYWGVTLRE